MRTQPSSAAIMARAAARRRAYVFIAAGVIAAVAMLVLSGEFVALHCIVLAALTLAAALSCAWAAIPIQPEFARRAGIIGGLSAALAYVLPFIAVFLYRFATMDDATAARLAGEMSSAQATNLVQQNIVPGVEYFRGQYLSYVFGYLLFGLAFGALFGGLGGLLARRQTS
jgi:hypothetical protein